MIVTTYPTRETWLAARRIGGSDAPKILGIPFTADGQPPSLFELWAQKTGKISSERPEMKDRFDMGRHAEALLARKTAEARPDLAIYDPGDFTIVRNGDYPWMTATVDRLAFAAHAQLPMTSVGSALELFGHAFGPLSLKTVEVTAASDWDEEPSRFALVQLHHEMIVGGWSVGMVAAYIGFGKFRLYEVERNEALCELILEQEEAFWKLVVQADKPPAVDGSEACRKAILAMHPRDTGEVRRVRSDRLHALAFNLAVNKARLKEIEAEVMAAENEVRLACGDATELLIEDIDARGATPPIRFTYKHQTRAGYTVGPSESRVLLRKK